MDHSATGSSNGPIVPPRDPSTGRSKPALRRWAEVMSGLADGRLVTADDGRVVATSAAAERALGKLSVGYFSRPLPAMPLPLDEPGVKRTTHTIDTPKGRVDLVVLSADVGDGHQGVIVSDPEGRIAFWTEGAEGLNTADDSSHADADLDRSDVTAAQDIPLSSQLRDPLTGLANRQCLLERMPAPLARAARAGLSVMVQLIHLNQLNVVNSAYGISAGDQLLQTAAQRINSVIEGSDTLARLGDNEFVVLREEANAGDAQYLADRIAIALRPPFEVGSHRLYPSATIGIAVMSPVDGDPSTLLQAAREALHDAKKLGHLYSSRYDTAPLENPAEDLALATELHEALALGGADGTDGTDGLELHYWPIVELVTGRLIGVEATPRWQHPTRGWVPPEVFLSRAEDSDLAYSLDGWILRQAFRDAADLRRRGVLAPWAFVAVKISAQTATNPDLLGMISQAAEHARVGLDSLILEVAASSLLADSPAARRVMETLRDLGVGLTLDNFGTGYASLTQLRQLPVTGLKINRSLVRHITEHAEDRAIVASLVDLANARGLRTFAEGVETNDQLLLLDRLGCIAGRGNLWSEQLTRGELILLLKKRKARGFQLAGAAGGPRLVERRAGPRATNEHGLHRLQQLHRELASPDTIAAALNSEGYQTPSGVRWHGKSVASVLAELDGARRRRHG